MRIATPKHALQKKGTAFAWTGKENVAFQAVKENLTTDPVLILPDLRKAFHVQVDACGNNRIAAVSDAGRACGSHESCILQPAVWHLQIYEKGLSVVIQALSTWKHYLLGAYFMQTDHQSLHYVLTQAKLSKKHMRWADFLSMFHFQIEPVEGKKNVDANALCRKPQVSIVTIAYHML